MSHIKKRHCAYWKHLNEIFIKNKVNQSNETYLMLNPSEDMLSILKPKSQASFSWF